MHPTIRAALHKEGKSLLMLFMLMVAQLYASGGWQASGTFEPGQYGAIRAAIDDAFDYGLTGETFACNISTALNNQFDRFWNVVSGKVRDLQYDAVLFGYAYRGHWFWINNYRDNKFVIVWKDYNCQEELSRSWGQVTNAFSNRADFSDSHLDHDDSYTLMRQGFLDDDIWGGIYNSIRAMQDDVNVPNTISGVAAFGGFSEFAVCICRFAGGDWFFNNYPVEVQIQWFFFDTRAGKTPLDPLPV